VGWWASLKTRFRKHDYDLDNHDIQTCNNIRLDGIPVRHTSYHCTQCGNVLALTLSEMKHLPLPLSHGCPGRRCDEKTSSGIPKALLT
jgi:5-methylcytosine-specific restriction endonuclease McrA